MMRRLLLSLPLLVGACGGVAPGAPPGQPPAPAAQSESLSAAQVDSLWAQAQDAFRHGDWDDAAERFERFTLEAPAGDPRLVRARFQIGETLLARGLALEAARAFRRVSDDTPNDPLAADALLRVGDAYADLWRRPELDPSYGQTAIATYQELLNRYPNGVPATRARAQIAELQEMFAEKAYKAALYYLRYKAYDSAILYLRDLLATYPRSTVAPLALVRLIESYRVLGYEEDVRESCGYLRQYHPGTAGADEVCPQGVT